MKIFFRGSREQARDAIIGVVRSITGNADTHLRAARAVHTTIGLAALSDIKADFIRKSRGGTGEDGVKWKPLSPEYLAYGRRFGPGEAAGLKRAAGLGPGNRHRGLLSKSQDKRWKMIFATKLKRLAATIPIGEAKARAAQIAWTVLKNEGAKTKLQVFGNRKVEMLRDTGVLFNSLSPGEAQGPREPGQMYLPPADQIFDLTASGVIVGTNVPYAAKQNKMRPFLPVNGAPDVWVNRWVSAGRIAARAAFVEALTEGAA